MRIVIIGGEKSLIDGNWSRRLEAAGLTVVAHHHDKHRGNHHIPANAEAVIVIRDMARHRLSEPAKQEADKRGLPFAAVPRKWSKAEPILRMQGILPKSTKRSRTRIPVQNQHEAVLAYITEVWGEGRIPALAECQERLRLAFGPQYSLTRRSYNKLVERARKQVLLSSLETPSVEPVESEKPNDAYVWATLLLTEKPELVLDLKDYEAQVIALMDGGDSPDRCRLAAQEALKAFRTKCRKDPQGREEMALSWLQRWFTGWWYGESREYPQIRKAQEVSRQIFGRVVTSELYRNARVGALGAWAKNLIEIGQGQELLGRSIPNQNLVTLLETKKVKGFKVQFEGKRKMSRWYTSADAIQEYVASQSKPEQPDVLEPVQPETGDLRALIAEAVKEALGALSTHEEHVRDLGPVLEKRLAPIEQRLDRVETLLQGISQDVQRFHRVELLLQGISLDVRALRKVPARGFGTALETVVNGVSERGVAISLKPCFIPKGETGDPGESSVSNTGGNSSDLPR